MLLNDDRKVDHSELRKGADCRHFLIPIPKPSADLVCYRSSRPESRSRWGWGQWRIDQALDIVHVPSHSTLCSFFGHTAPQRSARDMPEGYDGPCRLQLVSE
jgi:hypothetical protein